MCTRHRRGHGIQCWHAPAAFCKKTGHHTEDACELSGALYLVYSAMLLEPECSTIGAFARGHSRRSADNLFGDEEGRLDVLEGNFCSLLMPRA